MPYPLASAEAAGASRVAAAHVLCFLVLRYSIVTPTAPSISPRHMRQLPKGIDNNLCTGNGGKVA